MFKVNLRDETDSLFNKVLYESNKKEDYQLEPINSAWNLFDAKTNEEIDLLSYAKEEPTAMSKWELINFAVQTVKRDLQKEGNTILSFCDLLDINPQIWFKDIKGNRNWVVVKHVEKEDDFDYRKWVGLEN